MVKKFNPVKWLDGWIGSEKGGADQAGSFFAEAADQKLLAPALLAAVDLYRRLGDFKQLCHEGDYIGVGPAFNRRGLDRQFERLVMQADYPAARGLGLDI